MRTFLPIGICKLVTSSKIRTFEFAGQKPRRRQLDGVPSHVAGLHRDAVVMPNRENSP